MGASPPGSSPHSTPVESALGSVVIALVPAAFAYFIGWTYLYYYLLEFGINVSELDLGVEAIIIYAVPPTLSVIKRYWWLVALVLLAAYGLMAYRHLIRLPRLNPNFYERIRTLHPLSKGVTWFFVLVAVVVVSAPLIQHVAIQRADDKWTRAGIPLQAPIEEPREATAEYKDYKTCIERRALDLVFADKNVYYLLCVSEINDDAGVVYEVRRTDSKLASVRWSRRRPSREGSNQ
jgi:hypothetical protein